MLSSEVLNPRSTTALLVILPEGGPFEWRLPSPTNACRSRAVRTHVQFKWSRCSLAGCGRGVLATGSICPGELLLASPPLLLAKASLDSIGDGSATQESPWGPAPNLQHLIDLCSTGRMPQEHADVVRQLFSGTQAGVEGTRTITDVQQLTAVVPPLVLDLTAHNDASPPQAASPPSVHRPAARLGSSLQLQGAINFNAYVEPLTDVALAAATQQAPFACAGLYADYAMFNVSAWAHRPWPAA